MASMISVKHFRSEIIKKKLEALPAETQKKVQAAVAEAGQLVVDRAKMLVPVNKGVLRDSIRYEATRPDGMAIKIGPSGAVLKQMKRPTNLPRWIEFGTAAQKKGQRVAILGKRGKVRLRRSQGDHDATPPVPFLFPAWKQVKKQARAVIAKAVNAALKVVARKG